MSYQQHFSEELLNNETNYFILDTKGGGEHEDIDFVRYKWERSKYNLVNEGDLVIFRRPQKASDTNMFYFFGAAKIGEITDNNDHLTAKLIKAFPFEEYIYQKDLSEFSWKWKERGDTWEHFFNQYGMNKFTKEDFVNLLDLSKGSIEGINYDAAAATEATQGIQDGRFSAEDKMGTAKQRSKQQVFSNHVKGNYGLKCALCSISTKQLLIGSHIIPWRTRKETRLDPSNGICLCVLHDKAFDKGFFTLDGEYRVVLSKNINDKVLIEVLEVNEGKKIYLPSKQHPNQEYLEYHRMKIFDSF